MPTVSELVSKRIGNTITNSQTWGGVMKNVASFGAVGDGVTDDTIAIQAAINAAIAAGSKFVFFPRGVSGVYLVTSLTNADQVIFVGDNASFSGITTVIRQINPDTINWNTNIQPTATSTTSSLKITRDANYTGGTSGFVNSGLYLVDTVRDGVTSFEWGITSVLNNEASAGEHVALYGQGNKFVNGGATWAGVCEARDRIAGGSTLGTLVGLEVDLFSNGSDITNRICIDVVVGRHDPVGTQNVIASGIRIGPSNGDPANGKVNNGVEIIGQATAGFHVKSTGTRAFQDSGTNTIGLDLSTGTHSGAAIRIKTDEIISFEATSAINMGYVAGNSHVNLSANYNLTGGVYKVGNLQVVGSQGAAVANSTGTGDVVAQFNTLLSRLRTHGLIAT